MTLNGTPSKFYPHLTYNVDHDNQVIFLFLMEVNAILSNISANGFLPSSGKDWDQARA